MRFQQTSKLRWLSRQRRLVLLLSLVIALLFALSLPARTQVLSSRRPPPRLAITPSPATVTTGQAVNFKIAMLDSAGRPMPTSGDRSVQLTLTTLGTLEAVKKQISAMQNRQTGIEQKTPPPKALNKQIITLASGQSLSRLEGLFIKGQREVTVKVVTQQTGRIRLFAESSGFSPGEAVLIAVTPAIRSKKYSRTAGESVYDYAIGAMAKLSPLTQITALSGGIPKTATQPLWLPALWSPQAPVSAVATAYKLELIPPGVQPRIDKGEWVADFSVALMPAAHTGYSLAPEEIRIILRVLQGAARFDPANVRIESKNAISETFVLRSRLGGKMELAAAPIQTGSLMIGEDRIPFEFQPGTHATHLRLTTIKGSALANNLDEVILEVRATQMGADGKEYVVRADDESLPERRVSFSAERGFGVRFENGSNQVTIPQGQDSIQIKLFSSLPSRELRVSAESTDGLQERILGDTIVSFQLPVWPIILAVIGGLVWGVGSWLVRKAALGQSLFRGSVGGFVFYIIVFFGALAMSYFEPTGLPLDIARLPTANSLAAFVIGLVGARLSGWVFESGARLLGKKQKANS